ncbi:toxin [Streptomyces xanthochromogenes]
MSGFALTWFKSSYSSDEGGQCLEMACAWRKSSYSGSEGGACVEMAAHPAAVHVRDSKNPEGPTLTLDPAAWRGFLTAL